MKHILIRGFIIVVLVIVGVVAGEMKFHLRSKLSLIAASERQKDNQFLTYIFPGSTHPATQRATENDAHNGAVLAAATANPNFVFNVNVPSNFSDSVTFKNDAVFNGAVTVAQKLTAPNIVYSLSGGNGISIGTGQNPIVSNTGVLSLQGSTGALSLSAGSGIAISGLTISNGDAGSSQNIFKNIAVSGQSTIGAGSNNDTLTFVSGSGITLATDDTNKKLTITSDASTPDYTLSGWSKNSSTVYLTTSTNSVGIGTSSPAGTLQVVGNILASNGVGITGVISNIGGGVTTAKLTLTTGASSGYILQSDANGNATWIASSVGTTYSATNGLHVLSNQFLLGGALSVGTSINLNGNNLAFSGSGNVGIGTTNPAGTLQVVGNILASTGLGVTGYSTFTSGINVGVGVTTTRFTLTTGANNGYLLQSDANGNATWASITAGSIYTAGNGLTLSGGQFILGGTLTQATQIGVGNTAGSLSFLGIGGTQGLYLANNGFVGIGTTSPMSTLNVNGNLMIGTSGVASTTPSFLILGQGSTQPTNGVEGAMYYDTTLKQLMKYENGQWQSDRTVSTITVAASNSQNKYKADIQCTGTSDETCITNAVNSIPSSGGVIYLLEGVYNIGSQLSITKSNVSIIGAGKNTVLNRTADNYTLLNIGNGSTYVAGVTVTNLTIEGNKATYVNTSNYGIRLQSNVHNSRFQNLWMTNNAGPAIYSNGLTANDHNLFTDNYFGSNRSGIETYNEQYSIIARNVSEHNTFRSYYISYGFNNQVSNNTSTSNNNGFVFGYESGDLVTSNISVGDSSANFSLSGTTSQNIIFSNNQGYGNASTTYGILVTGSNHLIANNNIYNPNNYGIYLNTSSADITVTGNNITKDNGTVTGIYIQSTSTVGNVLSNNVFIGSTFSPTITDRSATTVYNSQIGSTNTNIVYSGIGNLGVGTTNPLSKLDVNGNANIATNLNVGVGVTTARFTLTTGANNGYILQSDASGNASWVTATGIGGTYTAGNGLSLSGSQFILGGTLTQLTKLNVGNTAGILSFLGIGGTQGLYLANNGFVGIGTTNPTEPLYVNDTQPLGPRALVRAYSGTPSSGADLRMSTGLGGATPAFIVINPGGKAAALLAGSNGALFDFDSAGYFAIGAESNSNFTSNAPGAFFSDLLHITGGGLVGINTTTPHDYFDVNGSVAIGSLPTSALPQSNSLYVSGSAGIGTTNPAGTMQVIGNILASNGVGVTGIATFTNFVNASGGGLATYVKAGTIGDTDFTGHTVDGIMAYDSTDGRLYIRNGSAWSYIAKTAGFQIPNYEAYSYNFNTNSFNTSQPLAAGDFLMPFIEKGMSDGALHGLYAKFSDVKGLLFRNEDQAITDLQTQVSSLSAQLNSAPPAASSSAQTTQPSLDLTVVGKLTAQGILEVQGPATFNAESVFNKLATFVNSVVFNGSVLFNQTPTFNEDSGGQILIKKGVTTAQVTFTKEYLYTPIVSLTLLSPVKLDWMRVINVSTKGFTIEIAPSLSQDIGINWIAIAVKPGQSATPFLLPTEPVPTPTVTISPTPTLLITPSATPSATPTATLTPSPTATPTATLSPSATPTPTTTP